MLNDLAIALTQNNQVPQAISLLKHAVQSRPDSPEARLSLANALGQTGRPQEAIEQLQTALASTPASFPPTPL